MAAAERRPGADARDPRITASQSGRASRCLRLIAALVIAWLALPGQVTAGDAVAVWDHRPVVGYEDEDAVLALRPAGGAGGWVAKLIDAADRPHGVSRGDADPAVVTVRVAPGTNRALRLSGADAAITVRLVHPGGGAGLMLDAAHRLTLAGDPAVLVLPRVEAVGDRRWQTLRRPESARPLPCSRHLDEVAVPWGESALLAQVCAAQAIAMRGESLLISLPGADRMAGWKHREYRQVVAWLVADAIARGAAHVVLVQPCAPAVEDATLAPLRTQVRDVGAAYRCRVVETASLGDERWWWASPGILGTALNADGRRQRDDLLAPWRH